LTSAANDDAVRGERRTSSAIVNEPQLVWSATLAAFEDRRVVGRGTCVSSCREPGSLTRLQPAGSAVPAVTTDDVPGVLFVLELLEPPPQPAMSAASATATRSVRMDRDTAVRIMPTSPVPAILPLSAYDHVLLDLDGVVWVGDAPTPRAQDAIAALREAHKGIAFVTNDGRHADDDYVRKLWRLGFQASREEVVTVGGALQHVLAESGHRTAYVVGSPAVHRHVADAGLRVLNGSDLATRADVVVVAAHDDFDYRELRCAIQAVLRGAALVCAGRDATFPMPDGPWPGAGPIVAAIESATGVAAESVGKPEPQLFLTALDRLGPGRAIVVGDRLDADAGGARAAGLDCAIVLTGATSAADAHAADPPPTRVAASLAELVLGA
jgi:glycerol 3-phosphatase-2